MLKTIRINATYYFIMELPKKRKQKHQIIRLTLNLMIYEVL